MDGAPALERHHAAPTTRSPAGRAGRGAAVLAGRDSVTTAMLRSTMKSNGICEELEKLRLDFVDLLRLRRAMSKDTETCLEIARRLFCLITIAAEDATALSVEGQPQRLPSDHTRDSLARLRELGIRIEILSSAIAELIEALGRGDEAA